MNRMNWIVVLALASIIGGIAFSGQVFAWNGDGNCGSYQDPCICEPDTQNDGCAGEGG